MTAFQKALLVAGLFIFGFATLGMLYQEAIMVILFTIFVPGPVLGLIISIFKKAPFIQRLLFFTIACIIYVLTLLMIDIKNIDYKLSPLNLLFASSASAVLIQLFFDIIFKSKINFRNTFYKPALFGLLASILTTLAAFYFESAPTTGWLTVPLWIGLFSIFPLWYVLLGKHLTKTGKVCS